MGMLDIISPPIQYQSKNNWIWFQVHGDIKGNNVLISGDGIAMLTDFDNAELGERSLVFTRTGRLVLSPRWTAPEVILGLTGKTLEADVYSLAMTILEVMTRKAPWANIPTDMGVVSAVVLRKEVPPRPTSINRNDLWSILVDCWKHEQNARPGPADILKMLEYTSTPLLKSQPTTSTSNPVSIRGRTRFTFFDDDDDDDDDDDNDDDDDDDDDEAPESPVLGSFPSPSPSSFPRAHPFPRARLLPLPGACPSPEVGPKYYSAGSSGGYTCSEEDGIVHSKEGIGDAEEDTGIEGLSQERPEPDISSQVGAIALSRYMSVHDILSHLNSHGCQNVSQSLDSKTFNVLPNCYGGSGDIYYGKLLDSTTICVKVPRIVEDASQMEMKNLYASREIHTWSKCNHPNILPLLGLAIFRNRLAIVSPWMQNGNLPNFLKKNPNADRFQLCTQICDGVAYLHNINIVHGDLKGENVLISDNGTALLTDFGSADLTGRTITFTHVFDKCGWTMRWGAPEIVQEMIPLSKAGDIYALGMTILEAVTGEPPFTGKNEIAVMLAVCFNKEIPTRPLAQIPVDNEHGNRLWDLLSICWSHEAEKRPSAAEVRSIMATITKEGLSDSSGTSVPCS
ncbi:kinase-like protein, partial [Rhizoctonia solani]